MAPWSSGWDFEGEAAEPMEDEKPSVWAEDDRFKALVTLAVDSSVATALLDLYEAGSPNPQPPHTFTSLQASLLRRTWTIALLR